MCAPVFPLLFACFHLQPLFHNLTLNDLWCPPACQAPKSPLACSVGPHCSKLATGCKKGWEVVSHKKNAHIWHTHYKKILGRCVHLYISPPTLPLCWSFPSTSTSPPAVINSRPQLEWRGPVDDAPEREKVGWRLRLQLAPKLTTGKQKALSGQTSKKKCTHLAHSL